MTVIPENYHSELALYDLSLIHILTKAPNHTECIRCGSCIRACPTGAVCFRYGFGDGKDKTKTAEMPQKNNDNKEK